MQIARNSTIELLRERRNLLSTTYIYRTDDWNPSPNSSMSIVMQMDSFQTYTDYNESLLIWNYRCDTFNVDDDFVGYLYYTCPDGSELSYYCDPTDTTTPSAINISCNLTVNKPSCPFWDGSTWNTEMCTVVSYTGWNTSCVCNGWEDAMAGTYTDDAADDSRRRRRQRARRRRRLLDEDDGDDGDDDDGDDDGTGSVSNVDFGAVAAAQAASLASTAGAVGGMSLGDLLNSLVILGSLAFAWGMTTWLVIVGFEKDRRDRRLHALEKRFGNAGRAEDFSQAGVLLGFKENMRGVIDRSLPEAFRLKPHQQFKNLMCNSHEWGSVFFRYDPVAARPVRTIIVAAAFFDVMFIEAIAYQQGKPQEPGGVNGCSGQGDQAGAPTFEQVDSQEEEIRSLHL